MTPKKTHILLALGVFLLVALGGVLLRPRRPETALSPAVAGPAHKWSLRLSPGSLSDMALGADGTIYVGARDGLYAVAPAGTLRWQVPTGDAVRGAPTVAPDGDIYFGTRMGSVYGVSPDGQQFWRSEVSLVGVDGSPALGGDGTLFVTGNVGDVFAFRPTSSGRPVWNWNTMRDGITAERYALPGDARASSAYTKASPAIGTDSMIYVGRRDWLHCFSPDDNVQWGLQLVGAFLGPIAVGSDGTLYAGSQRAAWLEDRQHGTRLYAVTRYGSKKWQLDTPGGVMGSPVIDADGTLYACAGTLIAVTPEGRLLWEYKASGSCTSGPVLAADGTLYLGWTSTAAWEVVAVTRAGERKWGTNAGGIVRATPVIGPDGTLYVATERGEVLAFWDSGSLMMESPWPKFQHDLRNTGRYAARP